MLLLDAVNRIFRPYASERSSDRTEKYLFIICMNNSGSTLLERVLSECQNAGRLSGAGRAGPAGQRAGLRPAFYAHAREDETEMPPYLE